MNTVTPGARTTPRMNRRALLRGMGVGLALPLLDCMEVASARARSERPPRRLLVISNNLGVLPKPFFPADAGRDYELSPYLEELKPLRNDITVFSGLSHPGVIGGHSTENCFLTAAKGPTRSGFRNRISLDQFVTEALGQQTRFPTLNLGVNIDRANRSLSWTRDGVLLPAEDSPSALFERMFVQGDSNEVERRLHELRLRGSILDAVFSETQQFRRGLGADDRQRLEQYFTSVRELEERLHAAGEWEKKPKPTTDREPPKDIVDKAQFFEKFDLMLSMARLALEVDATRVVTLMVDAFATPVFQIDESTKSINGYHNLSHHGQVPEKVSQLEAVDRQQMGLLREMLSELASKSDGPQRLLDSTMVLYGSNMGDSNTHDNTNLPILLAGGGFQHGQHLAFDQSNNTPLSNLFVSLLQQMGVETDKFGSSTGTLTGLEAGGD
jgi:hypothetical protein